MDKPSYRNRVITIGIIAYLLLAAIPAVMAVDGTTAPSSIGGTIKVMSFPEGAAVYLNEEYLGVTPITRQNITPGKYVVRVSMAGYNNNSIPIELRDGSTREIGFNLDLASSPTPVPSGFGSIAVDSTPGGAFVMVDGNNVGITPTGRAALIMNNIPTGSHAVTVELAGYPPYTGTVTVIKNQVARVNADLATTSSPTIMGSTPIPTTNRQQPAPFSPLAAVAAACIAGLAAAFRRS
jgi:hypothetical protein